MKAEKDRLRDAVANGEIKNILMVRCQKIGDMLTFLPTLLCVRKFFPLSTITLLCRRDGLAIAERIPFVNIMLTENVENNTMKSAEPFDLLITSSQDAGWIKLKKKMDIAFAVGILPDVIKGVCLKHRWQYRYFTDTERYSETEHDVQRNLKILRMLVGDECSETDRTLWITSSEREKARDLYSDVRQPLVVVSPSGSRSSKNWSPGHFALLCDKLITERNARIVFVGKGALAEKQTSEILSGMTCWAESVVDGTSFGEFSALIECADLLISVDSGPAHIASYLNRPLIVLFGPGDYDQWKPWHEDRSLGAALRAYCRCGTTLHKCLEKQHCLDSIMPDDVFEAAVRLLDRPHGRERQ